MELCEFKIGFFVPFSHEEHSTMSQIKVPRLAAALFSLHLELHWQSGDLKVDLRQAL